MAININLSNENKERIFDNNSGRKYTAASVISSIVESTEPPKVNHSVSLEYSKDKFWKEILAWEYSPVNGRRLIHISTEDKACLLSIFPDYAGVYLNVKNRLEIFRRGENDTFEKAIEGLKLTTAGAANRPLVAINSAFFSVPDELYYTKYAPGLFLKYSEVIPNGRVVHNGTIFNNNYNPSNDGFYISYKYNTPPASEFSFGSGEAPLYGDGIGASTPILVFNSTYNKVWKYGDKNVYQAGHTGPDEGDPGSSGQFLQIRSNRQYRKLNSQGTETEGKNIIAYCKSKDVLLLITVPQDLETGKKLDYYRDHLYRLGFENAIAVDGSTSAVKYMYSNKKYYAAPDRRKNNSIPLGFIFYL